MADEGTPWFVSDAELLCGSFDGMGGDVSALGDGELVGLDMFFGDDMFPVIFRKYFLTNYFLFEKFPGQILHRYLSLLTILRRLLRTSEIHRDVFVIHGKCKQFSFQDTYLLMCCSSGGFKT